MSMPSFIASNAKEQGAVSMGQGLVTPGGSSKSKKGKGEKSPTFEGEKRGAYLVLLMSLGSGKPREGGKVALVSLKRESKERIKLV